MMHASHNKDKKITILYSATVTNDNGFEEQKWIPVQGAENIWAYFRHASGSEFYAAATINSKVEVIFEINWRDNIDTYMRIRYKNQDYSITRIDNFEGYKTDLRIYAFKVD